MSMEKEEPVLLPKRKVSCTVCFNALWFCYSPVHQMQQYYRLGSLDNCSGKWGALVDCLKLKTKSSQEVSVIFFVYLQRYIYIEWPTHICKLVRFGQS
ncbi:hypothetical protein HanPI659440_Chr07g0272451 [Helianthus annuus]|nr:hypothetical protein HanPI659440_Chr07g0272451 [Helianthus annuus]